MFSNKYKKKNIIIFKFTINSIFIFFTEIKNIDIKKKTKKINKIMEFTKTKNFKYSLKREELEKLRCYICLKIFSDPVLDKCGHSFCKICIKDYLKIKKICPISKNPIKKFFPNRILNEIISEIKYICNICKKSFNKKNLEHFLKCEIKKKKYSKKIIIDKYYELFLEREKIKKNILKLENKFRKIKKNRYSSFLRNNSITRNPFVFLNSSRTDFNFNKRNISFPDINRRRNDIVMMINDIENNLEPE